MNRYLYSAAVVGVVAGLGWGAEVKSGLAPGAAVPVFNPLHVTGPDAGEKRCPV